MLDGISLNQLRAFVAVCDAGSFSGAARRLGRAQSAVSHAVAALETALGAPLFVRDTRQATLSPAGRTLLIDARAVIARTEEMKHRAAIVARVGAPQIGLAVDAYFPRPTLLDALQTLRAEVPTLLLNLRTTTMQTGEALVVDGTCSMAVTVADVPELDPSALERAYLGEVAMETVCAPDHPLATAPRPVSKEEFSRHVQLVVTDNQPDAERSQRAVAGTRQWLLNDLNAKHDFLLAGLGWGHMPTPLVAGDLADGRLVALPRRAWHIGRLTFMISRRRGDDPAPAEARLMALLAGG